MSVTENRIVGQVHADHGTSRCVVDCSRIKWAWLRLLDMYDRSFVLKRGINF